jgi:hypothetical protein
MSIFSAFGGKKEVPTEKLEKSPSLIRVEHLEELERRLKSRREMLTNLISQSESHGWTGDDRHLVNVYEKEILEMEEEMKLIDEQGTGLGHQEAA